MTPLRSGFHIVRYDVAFAAGHRIDYRFPGDHFELEHCVEGRVRVSEDGAGADELHAGSVALSPRRATGAVVAHGAGERYRAVSVTGSWAGLDAYLGGLGARELPVIGPERGARERYIGRSAALRPVAQPLAEM